ncbi:hypothetical protein H4219_000287 [Mycoemilia scoparia]|uniref:Homeobox domain-containing protein n=1 Tax=Mycoemilia scoparia TaxID=417184 RepID=A0A9W8DXG9_9FUNG|nr:hypothetical protein H4219_000287 [Mycoemilia scoparia]
MPRDLRGKPGNTNISDEELRQILESEDISGNSFPQAPYQQPPTGHQAQEDIGSSSFQSTGIGTSSATANDDQLPKKRTRKALSFYQIRVLTRILERTSYPCRDLRERIASSLNMPSRNVQVWFQNQRQKTKERGRARSQLPQYHSRTAAIPAVGADPSPGQPHHMGHHHHQQHQKQRDCSRPNLPPPQLPPLTSLAGSSSLFAPAHHPHPQNPSSPVSSAHHQSVTSDPFVREDNRYYRPCTAHPRLTLPEPRPSEAIPPIASTLHYHSVPTPSNALPKLSHILNPISPQMESSNNLITTPPPQPFTHDDTGDLSVSRPPTLQRRATTAGRYRGDTSPYQVLDRRRSHIPIGRLSISSQRLSGGIPLADIVSSQPQLSPQASLALPPLTAPSQLPILTSPATSRGSCLPLPASSTHLATYSLAQSQSHETSQARTAIQASENNDRDSGSGWLGTNSLSPTSRPSTTSPQSSVPESPLPKNRSHWRPWGNS